MEALKTFLRSNFTEFSKSIKSPDTEERLDLVFYRPLGFIFAKFAKIIHVTPTQLTILGMLLGVISGYCFYNFDQNYYWLIGAIFLLLSGILDSSDGQLARMTGNSTKLGLVLDGICDNVVMMSIYLFGAYLAQDRWGMWIWPIVIIGGVSHSFQSAILDFYHREYLYFGYGKARGFDYWNPTVVEARENIKNALTFKERLIAKLRFSWIWEQNFLSGRSAYERLHMQKIILGMDNEKKQKLMDNYRVLNKPMLSWWRLMGTNFHTICILFFTFAGAFDFYVILIDILLLNLLIPLNQIKQAELDALLFKEIGLNI